MLIPKQEKEWDNKKLGNSAWEKKKLESKHV